MTSSCVSLTIYQQCHTDIDGDVAPIFLQYQNVHWEKVNFSVHASQQNKQTQEKVIKIMVANSGMKHKYETMLEVIRGLVLDSVLYFVTI